VADDREHGAIASSRGTLWRVLQTMLLCVLAIPWFLWGPFGVIFYVDGLFNSLLVFMLSPVLFLLLPLGAVVCLPILVMRTVLRGSGLEAHRRRSFGIAAIMVFAFVCSYGLSFAGLSPAPFDMFARGFSTYVERRTDVEAIQSWLGTLDPNDYFLSGNGRAEKSFVESEQPLCIARLAPKLTRVQPDDDGRLTVSLLWGGGLIGHWGIVVGPESMPMPPSDPSGSGLHQYPLAPGAYIWSSD
jgi:hypothetical protein